MMLSTLGNVKAIVSLGLAGLFSQQYESAVRNTARAQLLRSPMMNFVPFTLQFLSIGSNSVVVWFAMYLVLSGDCSVADVFQAITCIIFPAIRAGTLFVHLPDLTNAWPLARVFYKTLTDVDSVSSSSCREHSSFISGKIEFHDVSFAYPARPEALVLDRVSFVIPAGATAAFVGGSGSGQHGCS